MYYVYLISDFTKKNIHAGYCSSVSKMVNFYKECEEISFLWKPGEYLNRLVYFEEVNIEGQAIDRMLYFTFLPLQQRIKEIETTNPEWFDLTTVPNYPF